MSIRILAETYSFVSRTLLLLIFSSFYVTSPNPGFSCEIPPEHTYLPHEKAIEHAEWIARATALRELENGVEMKAVEYIKGDGPRSFILPRAQSIASSWEPNQPDEANYFGHTVSGFWRNGGRSLNRSDCLIHPRISFQNTEYLIFGPLDYNVGFENVTSENDLWLEYVRKYVNRESPRKPFPKPINKIVKHAQAIVLFEAQWEQGRATWKEHVLLGDRESYAHTLFVSPSAYFDTEVNPNCIRYGTKRVVGEYKRLFILEALPKQKLRTEQSIECVGPELDGTASIKAIGLFSVYGHSTLNVTKDGRIEQPVGFHDVQIWEEDGVFLRDLRRRASK